MKRIVLALGITALALPLMGTLEPAEARVSWNVGADFSVGGIFFSLGFNDFDRYTHAPRYVYRTQRAFHYRGYQCGSACYIDDGYYYHDRSCPVVGYHFAHYRYDPSYVWTAVGFGPYRYRSYRPHHGPWAYGYRYDSRRWDRHDRRHDWRPDHRSGQRRYDSDGDSDSDRRGGRFDRRGPVRRSEGRVDRGDDRRDRRGAERSRSRRRDRD